MEFIKFSKIGQFREVAYAVNSNASYVGHDDNGNAIYDKSQPKPVIKFSGTCKLHGTNAGVGMDSQGNIWAQSRKNIITTEKDNAGFAFFVETNKEYFTKILTEIKEDNGLEDQTVVVFGEWCGGGIQKGVAINGLDKMFVIFAVKVAEENQDTQDDGNRESSYYLTSDKWSTYSSAEKRIYNINDYKKFEIEIDFNDPQRSINDMIAITEQVEKECPVGKAFGRVLGEDNTTGEGVVWVGWNDGNRYVFKCKGQKHSASKVKKLASVDIEKLNSIKEFVEYAVTDNRLNQAIEQVFTIESKQPEMRFMGDFIRWVIKDVTVEEQAVLVENGLEPKEVNSKMSAVARDWFKNYLDTNL